ncbi:MAG: DUF2281 domain-containing protein [Treponema sp.]|nr:DUF2281 domain-containing protein [Treponema sp.]
MPLAVLQQKLNAIPEEYFDEVNAFFDFLSYKVTFLSTNNKTENKVIPGLAEGKWKYPKDINAFDDARFFDSLLQ